MPKPLLAPLFHVVEKRVGFNKDEVLFMIQEGNGSDAILIHCGPDETTGHDSIMNCPRNSNKIQPFQALWAMEKFERTPLYMAWDNALNTRSSSKWAVGREGRTKSDGIRQEKAFMFLEKIYMGQKNGERKRFLLLHAALTFHQYLPVEVFEHALDHYIDEINEIEDGTGRTPLHIAAATKIGESTFLEIIDAYANSVHSGGKKNLLIPQDNIPKEFIVAAMTRDRSGRLPLFIALENGYWLGLRKEGVVERLLSAGQSSFTIRDETTRLFPFMLAAVGSSATPRSKRRKSSLVPRLSPREAKLRPLAEDAVEEELDDTTLDRAQLFTIYALLRRDPGVLRIKKKKRNRKK